MSFDWLEALSPIIASSSRALISALHIVSPRHTVDERARN